MNCDICGASMPWENACGKCDLPNMAIVRFYKNAGIRRRVIKRGVTIREAQAWCHDPETSSTTATSSTARQRTKRVGEWFDGYCNLKTATYR